jgi:hypothetical protein
MMPRYTMNQTMCRCDRSGALREHMHIVSRNGRDYAMCKIQTRVAPEAQL